MEFYDGQKEAFLDNGAFNYYVPGSDYADEHWLFTEGPENLYAKEYKIIEFDHTNEGTVYFTTLLSDDEDIVYFFRYAYMRDVSGYVKTVEQRLQTDNPITQINVELKNIDDSLYTSDATLFAPSSMMQLGVSYGDSAIVPMGFAYIDQATVEFGGEMISLSGRNRTGVYLKDQNFDEDMTFTDTPSRVAEDILHIFGLDDYSHIDTSGDGTQESPVLVTVEVKAKTTGLEALETLNKIMTNYAAGNQWKFEETYDGDIIVGYDTFRSIYIPKNYYTFNGRNDVFMETIDRCIDGVYSKVHVTGVTPQGKEISYTYSVTNFRFWEVGENRIYHADKIEGITKTELKKYAKALAKQLKYIGRVITYRMNLKPHLLIGDVAVITYTDSDEPEELGHITEIGHTLGDDGYFTEFTITSGGNVTAVGYQQAQTRSRSASTPQELVYTADKSISGTNRIRRLVDYFGPGSSSLGINASTTIIQGESLNFPEVIRNIGFRLLDEPKNVNAVYDEDNNSIKIKWTDPDDIDTEHPVKATWAGTVVVRSENGSPLHRWDGVVIVDSTTRDEYKNDWLVDDTVEQGTMYYYAIMPYDTKGDYRYTKVVQISAGGDISDPVITDIRMGGAGIWDGSEVAILWSGQNNKLTVQVSSGHIVFKLYTGNTEIYSFTSPIGSGVSDVDDIHVSFLVDQENEVAKPSFIYKTATDTYSYNQESPSDSEMADIYTWISAGI